MNCHSTLSHIAAANECHTFAIFPIDRILRHSRAMATNDSRRYHAFPGATYLTRKVNKENGDECEGSKRYLSPQGVARN